MFIIDTCTHIACPTKDGLGKVEQARLEQIHLFQLELMLLKIKTLPIKKIEWVNRMLSHEIKECQQAYHCQKNHKITTLYAILYQHFIYLFFFFNWDCFKL